MPTILQYSTKIGLTMSWNWYYTKLINKEETNMTVKRQMSEHAQAAKAIRAELKKAFPGIKFEVYSESYSMGNAVRVAYPSDLVTSEALHAVTDKYQYEARFGMDDSCIYKRNPNLPQARFVTVQKQYKAA